MFRLARTSRASLSRSFHSGTPLWKIVSFKLPDIGEGIAEVEVLNWHVNVGDQVEEFDNLVEVQSDKATTDITSRFEGTIKKLHFEVGDMAPTGSALVDIDVADDAADEDAAEPAEDASSAPAASSSDAAASSPSINHRDATSGKVFATPSVRRIARENNLDLTTVPGTGKDNRILKEDVLNFLKNGGASSTTPQITSAPSPAPSTPVSTPPAAPVGEDRVVPVRGIQRAMVKSMNAAWQIPHFGYCDEIRMDALMDFRARMKPEAEARGLKLSYLPVILKATSLALTQFPELNATCNPEASEVIHRASHNLGIAMDTPRGLIVPNVKNCQNLSIFDIAAELKRLMALAADGKLGDADLQAGTFSLSNIGAIGGTYASPVIMPPQVAIGALGKMQRVPVFVDGTSDAVTAGYVMNVSWSADHRVVDGATMARFSNLWKQYLEDPISMVADMH